MKICYDVDSVVPVHTNAVASNSHGHKSEVTLSRLNDDLEVLATTCIASHLNELADVAASASCTHQMHTGCVVTAGI